MLRRQDRGLPWPLLLREDKGRGLLRAVLRRQHLSALDAPAASSGETTQNSTSSSGLRTNPQRLTRAGTIPQTRRARDAGSTALVPRGWALTAHWTACVMAQSDVFGSGKGQLVGVGLGVWVAYSAPRRWLRLPRPTLVLRRPGMVDGCVLAQRGLASKCAPGT